MRATRKSRRGRRSLAKMPKRVKSRRMRRTRGKRRRGGEELTENQLTEKLYQLNGLIERTTYYALQGHGQYWNDVNRYKKEAEGIEAQLEKFKPTLTEQQLTERLKELTDKIARDRQFAETQNSEDGYYHFIDQDQKEANAVQAKLDKLLKQG